MIEFDPYPYEQQLLPLLRAIIAEPELSNQTLLQIVKQYPQPDGGVFSKDKLIQAYRAFVRDGVLEPPDVDLVEKIRLKPTRTLSGVTPVTVLTKPYPCPGQCIFCPTDASMPKSYLRDEPGAQRAEANRFDPYRQTFARLAAYRNIGHPTDKVEMIVLGGTWSAYPANYQRWFVRRIFDALNDFGASEASEPSEAPTDAPETRVEWPALFDAHRRNEDARSRCVGLVVETRPDYVTEREVLRLRKLGCTKVQIGFQSLDDDVLVKNRRGHDVAAIRRAVRLLRQAGFKIQAHWMANLYGSDPAKDVQDFERLFADPDFRPDELKLYPCSLIDGTGLMDLYRQGLWRPYTHDELLGVLIECVRRVPRYCRVTRMIRDIPAQYIVDGNTKSNLREVVQDEAQRRGIALAEIRSSEIRNQPVDPTTLQLSEIAYTTSVGEEVFLQFVTPEGRLAAFLRLCLPRQASFVAELGRDALIREVHVYGQAVNIGEDGRDGDRAQHSGLGARLIARARAIAAVKGYARLHVISAVGTRAYYRKLGFRDGELYQSIAASSENA